ncbi:hypothetical protein STEG23_015363 [Scotinomys teguina]
MSRDAKQGIVPYIRHLRDLDILVPYQSCGNTALLPVKNTKSTDYRPIQDPRGVNKRVEGIYPTILPNPYTLLSTLPPERVVYTVLDPKDAFFRLPLVPASQYLFASEWLDPNDGFHGQLT